MVITYTRDSAHTEYKGKDWVAYSWIDIIKDTLICWELKKVVENNTDVTFDELYDLLKTTYKNKKVKSSCDILLDTSNGCIDLIRKGVFPFILIKKI